MRVCACGVSYVDLLSPISESTLCRSSHLWELHSNLLILRTVELNLIFQILTKSPVKDY